MPRKQGRRKPRQGQPRQRSGGRGGIAISAVYQASESLGVEEVPGHAPVKIHGALGDAELLGHFLDREAGEVAQLDDARLARVEPF